MNIQTLKKLIAWVKSPNDPSLTKTLIRNIPLNKQSDRNGKKLTKAQKKYIADIKNLSQMETMRDCSTLA